MRLGKSAHRGVCWGCGGWEGPTGGPAEQRSEMTGMVHTGASADLTRCNIMERAYAQTIMARIFEMGYFTIRRTVQNTSVM